MLRLTKTSPLRVVLLLVLGMLVLDYVWVQTHPDSGRARSNWDFGMRPGGKACPDPAESKSARSGERDLLADSDYEWKLTALDGRETTLAEHRRKAVFINLWATWCGPCIAEMPGIQALYDSAGKEGVAFVVVSEEEPPTVKSFVEQEKYSFPVFTTEQLPEKFKTRGIPATFIVDKQGGIAHQRLGSADWDTESCRKFLRALL